MGGGGGGGSEEEEVCGQTSRELKHRQSSWRSAEVGWGRLKLPFNINQGCTGGIESAVLYTQPLSLIQALEGIANGCTGRRLRWASHLAPSEERGCRRDTSGDAFNLLKSYIRYIHQVASQKPASVIWISSLCVFLINSSC